MYLFKWLTKPLIGVVLTYSLLMSSIAQSKPNPETRVKFKCTLSNTSEESIYVNVAVDVENQIRLDVNGRMIAGLFVPNAFNHSLTTAFAASYSSNVYTLVVHTQFYRPYPEGYDSFAPPATLAVQHADAGGIPIVEVYLGNCLFERVDAE